MERWRTHTRLPEILDVLIQLEEDPVVRRLADAFGGDPVEVRQRLVGEPARRTRRLLFASGGEIILHDDLVAAVVLHFVPTATAPRGLQLSEWITGTDNDATLDDLKKAIGVPRRFAGSGGPYFTLDGGYVRVEFKDGRGWNSPGNLVRITVTEGKPGQDIRPEDDDCPRCADLLVRRSDTDGGVDVDSTVDSLATAVTARHLTESASWVKLTDLRRLHASGLMDRVESQFTCTTCKRTICFTLSRDSAPTFGYHSLDEARRRPLQPIPPVEQWGDESRIVAEREAMQYVDHEPAVWFLVEQKGTYYLDARYSYSALIDDSALICLNESELAAYRAGGHDYLSSLARKIHNSAPYREESPFYERNLYRVPGGSRRREEVSAAIINHTWLAQQRR